MLPIVISNSQKKKKIIVNAFPSQPQIINIMHLANKCITPWSSKRKYESSEGNNKVIIA